MRTFFRKTLLCYFFVEGSVKTMEETRRKDKNKKNEKNDENRTEKTPNHRKKHFLKCQWSARNKLVSIYTACLRQRP